MCRRTGPGCQEREKAWYKGGPGTSWPSNPAKLCSSESNTSLRKWQRLTQHVSNRWFPLTLCFPRLPFTLYCLTSVFDVHRSPPVRLEQMFCEHGFLFLIFSDRFSPPYLLFLLGNFSHWQTWEPWGPSLSFYHWASPRSSCQMVICSHRHMSTTTHSAWGMALGPLRAQSVLSLWTDCMQLCSRSVWCVCAGESRMSMRGAVAGCVVLACLAALLVERTEGHITFFSPKEILQMKVSSFLIFVFLGYYKLNIYIFLYKKAQ